jgi:hypothetical protein
MNSAPVTAIPAGLELCYGPDVIGHVTDVFFSDQTWYGIFAKAQHAGDNPSSLEILNFISVCEDWNKRMEQSPDKPPSLSEFDRYSDLVNSELWYVRTTQGDRWHLVGAPVFLPGGDITWRTR